MLTYILVVLYTTFSFGQKEAIIDSLLSELKLQAEDSSRVNTLNELAWELRISNPNKATSFATEAKKLSTTINNTSGLLTSLNRLGVIAFYQKDYTKAKSLYLEILDGEKKMDNKFGIGRAHNQLGEIYKGLGDIQKSIIHSKNSLEIFEEINSPSLIAVTATNLGDSYRNSGEFDKALEYFFKSLEIHKEGPKNSLGLGITNLSLGACYNDMMLYDKAITYLEESFHIFEESDNKYEMARIHNNLGISYFGKKEYSKSLNHYNQALKLKEMLGLVEKDARLYNNIGAIYYKQNEIDLSKQYYTKSISIQKSQGSKAVSDAHGNLGDIYFRTGDYNKAIKQYKEALKIAREVNDILVELKILQNLMHLYSKQNQKDKALTYSELYINLRDSIEITYRKGIDLKDEYEKVLNREKLLEKDKEIAEVDLEKVKAESEKKTILITSLSVGLLLLFLLFFSVFRIYRQKQKIRLAKKEKEINEQKVAQLLKNKEIESLDIMIEGREKERQRIAQDLHDRLGSMLSMVKIHFKSVEDNIEQIKASNLEQYKKANTLLDEACDEVRKVAHHMATGTISKFGLIPAVEELRKTLDGNNQIDIEFFTHGIDERLKTSLEIPIYRIIQELISNIIKHSKATSASIQLILSKNNLNLTVEDNGVGFDFKNMHRSGIGLKSVSTRVEKINGELSIDSSSKSGTTVTINIPINENYD